MVVHNTKIFEQLPFTDDVTVNTVNAGNFSESPLRPSLRSVMLLGVTYNTNNYGVRVLLSGAVASLAQACPKAQIHVLDYQRDSTTWMEQIPDGVKPVKLVNLRFSWKFFLPNNIFLLLLITALAQLIPSKKLRYKILCRNAWLKQILETDLHLSLAGGDSFSDIYRLERFFYVALPQLLVLWLEKPLVLLPQTYGPFKSFIARKVAGYIFRRAKAIFSRDSLGVSTVARIGGANAPHVQVVPDIGFAMEPETVEDRITDQIEKWRHERPIIGLNISKLLYMGGYTGNNMFGLKENYQALTRSLIQFIVEKLNASVLLVPHVYGEVGETEIVLCRELQPELEKIYPGHIKLFNEYFNHRQIKSIIGMCDLFVGARMHACIAAVSQCVPTVALAYSDKFAGVMDIIGTEGVQVVDLRRASATDVCEALKHILESRTLNRIQLEQRIPVVQELIKNAFETSILAEQSYCNATKV